MVHVAFEVATTRPETMFGDVAVAVNPNDDRYKDLIGQMLSFQSLTKLFQSLVTNTLTQNLVLVKKSPAHDILIQHDFLVGQRHNLPQINVMNDDGTMNELYRICWYGPLEARKAVVKNWKNRCAC